MMCETACTTLTFQKCPPKVTIGQIQQVACGYMVQELDPVATVIGVSGLVYDCEKERFVCRSLKVTIPFLE